MKKIKTLIVGLGKVGFEYDKNHIQSSHILTHSKALKKNKNYKLIGGVDIDKKKRILFSKKYQVKVFNTIKECSNMKIDLGVISVPAKVQYSVFKELANLNIKNIICEKPISIDNTDANKIFKISKQKKIKVIVNFLRRYNPAIIKLKNKLDKGSLGKILNGYFWYKENLQHGGCHFIDLILYLFGMPIYYKVIDSKKNQSPNIFFKFKEFKIFLFSSPKANYELGKFELQTNSSIIYYEDDKDITILKKKKNKVFVNENNLVLKEKISYKKNMNIKFVYENFNKMIKKSYNNNQLKDAIYNLKLCNFFLR